jgi:hypothetical protein
MQMNGEPRKCLLTENPPKVNIIRVIVNGTFEICEIILQCFNITVNSFAHML